MARGKPVVGIIGGTITGNRGAEAMLVTSIGRVREFYPEAVFKVFSYYPKQDRTIVDAAHIDVLSCKPAALVMRFFPFACIDWLLGWFHLRLPDVLTTNVIRALRQCDLLLDISGVSFVDGREKFLPFNILAILPAMLLHVPVVKLSQAMGPFRNPINRLAAGAFLPRCAHVFARGAVTESHLADLGLINTSRAADVAFSFLEEDSLTIENEDLVEDLERRILTYKKENMTVIAICPSALVHEQSRMYIEQITGLIRSLDGEQVRFIMLANSNRQSSVLPRNNDLYVLRILQDHLKKQIPEPCYRRIDWAIWDINTAALRKLMAHCDLLLTSRFHAMISGLVLCIPTLVIGWSHKYAEVLAEFGMEAYAVDFEDASCNLGGLAASLLENRADIQRRLVESLNTAQTSSRRQFEIIKQIIP